jgi:anaerobic ribonucleoside-triphosphate reductase activating protein
MEFKCAGVTSGTINGIGLSLEIFFQGCLHDCSGCQNPSLQDFSLGYDYDTDHILTHLEQYPDFYSSVVFTGGDPLYQPIPLYSMATKCKLPTILYSGFYYNEIPDNIKRVMTVIIDGPYIQELATNGFPASRNQTIHLNKELLTNENSNDIRRRFRRTI